MSRDPESPTLSLERRRASRLPIVIPVELADAHGFSLHSTSDLSTGGAFFARAIPHPVGERIRITLDLPGGERISCEGHVANVPDAHGFGFGVMFDGLAQEDRERLESFIREHHSTDLEKEASR